MSTTGEAKFHKAFNFDLIIAELKEHYPGGHHTKAYKDIQSFMEKNGFDHRQGSGYRSRNPMDDPDILEFMEKLRVAFPWLNQCVSRFDVTNVGNMYDLKAMLVPEAELQQEQEPPAPSLRDRAKQAAKEAKAQKKTALRTPPNKGRAEPER